VSGMTAGSLCLHPAAGLLAQPTDPDPRGRRPFSFLVLGDLHFARPEFYNDKAADYARKMCAQTAEAWDALWDEIHTQVKELEPRPSFVLQLGDYVHGD